MSLAEARSRREKKRNSMRSMGEGIVGDKPYTMNDPKINVPEGMLEAAHVCCDEQVISRSVCPFILEAALRWLAENPIVPTAWQYHNEMDFDSDPEDIGDPRYKTACALIAEWQRRMFLAPEPEVTTHLLGETFQKVAIDTDEYNSTVPGTALFWRNTKEWLVSPSSIKNLGGFAGVSIRGCTPEFLKACEEEKDGYSLVFIKIGGFGPGEKAVVK